MKYLFYIIIGLATIVLVYFGVFNREQSQRANHQPAEQSANTSQGGWETKTDDQPPVTINITPIEFGRERRQYLSTNLLGGTGAWWSSPRRSVDVWGTGSGTALCRINNQERRWCLRTII